MASAVSSSKIYARNACNMYYLAPTVTNEYMVHGSNLLDLNGFKAIGAKIVCATITTPITLGIGVSTASAATAYTIAKTAITTSGTAQTSTQVELDVDELAALGTNLRYAAVYVSTTATSTAHTCAVHVTRAYPKRAYSGLTSAQTTSTAAVTGTGS